MVSFRSSSQSRRTGILTSHLADPNVAVACVFIGLLIGYIELLRPGLVLPGVAGLVLVMLGIASLSALPSHLPSLALVVAAFVLLYLDARFRLYGIAGLCAAALMAAGLRYGLRGAVSWAVAIALSVPYILITDWLLGLALRARANKYTVD
jgi:membrane-bound serine protease (ClpP class)